MTESETEDEEGAREEEWSSGFLTTNLVMDLEDEQPMNAKMTLN